MSLWTARRKRLGVALAALLWKLVPGRAAAERRKVPARPGRVLFVCKGNICRSVYAEYRARALAGAASGWTFESSGLEAKPGTPSPDNAVAVAARRGIDLAVHRSRVFDPARSGSYDAIFVMEPWHQGHALLRTSPVRATLLGAFHAPPLVVVRDPYGRDASAFETAFDEIDAALAALFVHARGAADPGRQG
jgi:protein-tyrosine phosphatase